MIGLIDDDDVLREKVRAMLEAQGFSVFATGDSRRAEELIEQHSPDAVVVDMIMPDKDGVELIGLIHSRWPKLRIVAISGGGRIGPELFLGIAEKMGAQASLRKPFTAAQLRAAVQPDG